MSIYDSRQNSYHTDSHLSSTIVNVCFDIECRSITKPAPAPAPISTHKRH